MSTFLDGLNQTAAFGLAALLNTLWYAAAVAAITWVGLRYWQRVNAATRYWIWTTVLGFLVILPFLPALVTQVEIARSAPATVAPRATVPAAPQAVHHLAPVTLTLNSAPGSNHWPLWLLAVWVAVAGWQLIRLLRGAASVPGLKARSGAAPAIALPIELRRRVQLLRSDEINSPVAVGYLHPSVIIPTRLLACLEEDERKDVLLHELAHLVRYDDWLNLATRGLGALLILHPLAGIVLKQIEREREMACDDFVVAHTGSARSYARSLARLHDLHSTEGTRLLAPALLGRKVSLSDRLESLLRHGREFSARPSLANLAVSAFLFALLLGAGGLIPGWIAIAQTEGTSRPSFEVASIKPAKSGTHGSSLQTPPGRFVATNLTAKMLIAFAYNYKGPGIALEENRILGGPGWINTERFDVEAKVKDSLVNEEEKKRPFNVWIDQIRLMVQTMLAERFKLKVSFETKELPIYALVVAKHGPKLTESKILPLGPLGAKRPESGHAPALNIRFSRGAAQLSGKGVSISFLAKALSGRSDVDGRDIVDQTGLKGRYDFSLSWTPEEMGRPMFGGPGSGGASGPMPGQPVAPASSNSSGPSIFMAVQQQLGLKLKPEKGPVEVLGINHIEPPTPN